MVDRVLRAEGANAQKNVLQCASSSEKFQPFSLDTEEMPEMSGHGGNAGNAGNVWTQTNSRKMMKENSEVS